MMKLFVIEGKSGKSRVLKKAVNELPEGDCIVIDRVGIPTDWNKANFAFLFKNVSHDSVIDWLKVSLGKYIVNENTLVLEVNCPKDKLKDYLELEDILGFERYMITAQNDKINNILEYNTFFRLP
jgi:hypothetical protein